MLKRRCGGFQGFAEGVAVVEGNLAVVRLLCHQVVANALVSLDEVRCQHNERGKCETLTRRHEKRGKKRKREER